MLLSNKYLLLQLLLENNKDLIQANFWAGPSSAGRINIWLQREFKTELDN